MGKHLNILLVEAGDQDGALIRSHLQQGGYRVNLHQANTLEEMRAALADASWDLVISGYAPPPSSSADNGGAHHYGVPNGVAGNDVVCNAVSNSRRLVALACLQEYSRDIPFILVPGAISEESALEAMMAGAQDYVMKSNLTRLVPVIEREMHAAALRQERKRADRIQAATYKISASASNAKDLPELYASIHQIIGELMPAENFYIALYDPQTELLSFPYCVDQYEPPPSPRQLGRGLTDYVLRSGDPILATEEICRQLEATGEIDLIGAPSIDWLGTPLKTQEATIGVLVVQTYTLGGHYSQEDKDILVFVSSQIAMAIARKQSEAALRQSELRYRNLFEHSPVSVWEEDFSAVKSTIERLRQEGVDDFRTYFESRPEEVARCMSSIRVLDVNQATLRLYGAQDKQELLGSLETATSAGAMQIFKEELIAIGEGKTEFEGIGTHCKVDGEPVDIILRWNITQEYNDSLDHMIISVLDISERRNAERQTQAQIRRLDALRTVDMAITASMDMRVTLDVLLDQVVSQLCVDAAGILVLSPHSKMLEFASGRGFNNSANRTHIHLSEGYAGKAVLERRLLMIPDLSQVSDFFRSRQLLDEQFATYFGVPLIAKGQVKGVLEVYQRSLFTPTPDWTEFLETLAGQAAIAIDSATMFENLQRTNIELALAYDATIEGWSRALDLRDKETEGHTERVTLMTLKLAEKMGLSEEEMVFIRRGALLHDIGKMGIPDSILLKPGPLEADKWEVMRAHPVYAYELLSPISYLQPSLDIPYCHHEKWDGSGYPRGLKSEQIPLSARIFAVVDVYDALRSDRPYRPAWPEATVREHIRREAGKHFDPKIVLLFLSMLERGEFNLHPGII